jgi:dipeptidyl aminopeptidase/acylaminoacyl peptidase
MHRRTFLSGLAASTVIRVLWARGIEPKLGKITFAQAGNLWLRSLPSGQSRKLVAGARIQSPRFSPSGEWIAYHNGDERYVIRSDGSEATHLPSGSISWLPTEDVLAVTNNEGVRLLSSTNGWNAPKLVNKEARVPVFSPDGTQFIYFTAIERGKGPSGEAMRDGQLCRVVLTGAKPEPQVLISKYLTGMIPYAWARDEKSVLYWEDPDFSESVRADGLDLFRIKASGGSPQALGVTVLVHDDMLALSPVENKLAVTTGGGRESWSEKRIAIVDLDTLNLRYLTNESMSAVCPSWSPDGKQIAYAAAPDEHMNVGGGPEARRYLERHIWVADAFGATVPKQITHDDAYRDEEPIWSVDGTHLLFCRMDRDDRGALWLMSADGDNSIQVAGPLALGDSWFGYYGYIGWRQTFDWFRNPV